MSWHIIRKYSCCSINALFRLMYAIHDWYQFNHSCCVTRGTGLASGVMLSWLTACSSAISFIGAGASVRSLTRGLLFFFFFPCGRRALVLSFRSGWYSCSILLRRLSSAPSRPVPSSSGKVSQRASSALIVSCVGGWLASWTLGAKWSQAKIRTEALVLVMMDRKSVNSLPSQAMVHVKAAAPNLPARPTRCKYVAASRGTSMWITKSMCSASIPRAAKSVATKILHWYWRSFKSVCNRFVCVWHPEIDKAAWPWLDSWAAKLSALLYKNLIRSSWLETQ